MPTSDYLKTVRVTNTKNVLVQIPAWVVTDLELSQGDSLEVHYNTETKEIVIRCAAEQSV